MYVQSLDYYSTKYSSSVAQRPVIPPHPTELHNISTRLVCVGGLPNADRYTNLLGPKPGALNFEHYADEAYIRPSGTVHAPVSRMYLHLILLFVGELSAGRVPTRPPSLLLLFLFHIFKWLAPSSKRIFRIISKMAFVEFK